MNDEYEALCAAMIMLDAVHTILDDAGICEDECDAIHNMRNDINSQRVAALGNGQDRPWHVSDLNLTQGVS